MCVKSECSHEEQNMSKKEQRTMKNERRGEESKLRIIMKGMTKPERGGESGREEGGERYCTCSIEHVVEAEPFPLFLFEMS